MINKVNKIQTQYVGDFVDQMQTRGRYTFSRQEVTSAVTNSKRAIELALGRLVKKGRLLSPKRGFYVIVPLEYQIVGTPPVASFIDNLMKYIGQPYYVGLLSAAYMHGATHQAVQVFQVMTNKPQRQITLHRYRICFATKQQLTLTPVESKKTASGLIPVSTPEATAIDIVRYVHFCGGIHHISTVLTELSESMDGQKLVDAVLVQNQLELQNVQRLGYLLEFVGSSKITKPLYKWFKQQSPRWTPLQPGKSTTDSIKSHRWFLLINEHVESDI